MTLVLCLLQVLDFAACREWSGPRALYYLLSVPLAAFTFFALWHFWRGQNWARWMVLLMSVVVLLMVVTVDTSQPITAALQIVGVPVALWLLWWLSRSAVAQYFRSVPTWPSVGPAVKWTFVAPCCALLLVVAGLSVLVMLEPTPRPVFDAMISENHRRALQSFIRPRNACSAFTRWGRSGWSQQAVCSRIGAF